MQYPRDVAFTRRPLASAILAASLLALLPGAAVQAAEATQAQTQRIDFHISTQSLVDAIELFSAQSGY